MLFHEEMVYEHMLRELPTCVHLLEEEIHELHQKMEPTLESLKEDLMESKFLLEARQLRLIHDLQTIYPIEHVQGGSGEYSIRGIELPRDLYSRDEEQVAAGLGYVVHVLILLSKYLEVSLRYPLVFQASRSMIRDPVAGNTPSSASAAGGGVVLPLYRRNVDRERFDRALVWLQRDIEQLLVSRGFLYDLKKDILGNLHQLYGCDGCNKLAM